MFIQRRGPFQLRPEKSQRIIPLANVYSQVALREPVIRGEGLVAACNLYFPSNRVDRQSSECDPASASSAQAPGCESDLGTRTQFERLRQPRGYTLAAAITPL